MAFQADVAHLCSREHARIDRAVRFVARGASFEANGCVIEGEGAALFAVAGEASRLVGGEGLLRGGTNAAVWIVAIDAAHCAFGQLVMIRFLKLRPNVEMTAGAQRVDGLGAARHEPHRAVGMNLMARRACHLILRVTASQPPYVRGLVEVAIHADLVRLRGRELGGLANIVGRSRFGVLLRRSVTRFAGPIDETAMLILFDAGMRTLHEGIENVLMAGLASG